MSQDPNNPRTQEDDKDKDREKKQGEDEEEILSDEELTDASGGRMPSFIRDSSPVRIG